jgi:hypothetical protein
MKLREKCAEYLKYDFDEDEQKENAQKLARKNRNLAEHALKKKQLAADLKLEEEGLNSDIATLSRHVTDGYDFRMVDCRIVYNQPITGKKEISRIDTGELVRTDNMTDEERQEELPLRR